MAKVLGESARYASQEAVNQHERVVLHCMTMVFIFAVIVGGCVASFTPVATLPLWLREVLPTAALVGLLFLKGWGIKRLRGLEKKRKTWRRGASGEILVGGILSDFPDNYYVINDLKTEYGNLDHVVIGPTGVFVLETKNWRGVVDSDGNGELLLNGKKTDKDFVRQFVGRMMRIREKVQMLAHDKERHYQAALVFTAAWVDAKWGDTRAAQCIRDEQLFDYIVEKKVDKGLRKDDIKRLAQAFLSLAQMDEDFSQKPAEPSGVRPSEKPRTVGVSSKQTVHASALQLKDV